MTNQTVAGRLPHLAGLSLSGLVYAVSALQGDLSNFLAQVMTIVPAVGAFVHLIYHETQIAKDAYNVGESATISDSLVSLGTILNSATPDLNKLKDVATALVAAVKP